LKEQKEKPTARDLEKALRDVGISQKQAKTILAEGLEGYQRDADNPEPEPEGKEVERDVNPVAQRDVEEPTPKEDDETVELLARIKTITAKQN